MKIEDVRLREVKVQAGAGFQCRDVHGRIVKVKIRKLKDQYQAKLMEALRTIRDRLRPSNAFGLDEKALCVAMSYPAFVTTRHKNVGAWTSADRDCPFIVLNEQSPVWNDTMELAVTLLHELWHMLETMGCIEGEPLTDDDKRADSKAEAVHDLLCYDALGLDIPSSHYALKKYPELFLKGR